MILLIPEEQNRNLELGMNIGLHFEPFAVVCFSVYSTTKPKFPNGYVR